ncbi:hypothetical protein BRD00_01585 [Halobacteriales archaeon QS_8_69_26]|nr:MAG: hypothetical protein BRD00_01585 [Halobacteriales archaeon QS_8_69_26]
MDKDNLSAVELVVLSVALVGAVNWLLVDAASFNLVTETLGGTNTGIVYTGIGVAGVASLADLFGFLELEEIGGND